jgi:hypothetical protein
VQTQIPVKKYVRELVLRPAVTLPLHPLAAPTEPCASSLPTRQHEAIW